MLTKNKFHMQSAQALIWFSSSYFKHGFPISCQKNKNITCSPSKKKVIGCCILAFARSHIFCLNDQTTIIVKLIFIIYILSNTSMLMKIFLSCCRTKCPRVPNRKSRGCLFCFVFACSRSLLPPPFFLNTHTSAFQIKNSESMEGYKLIIEKTIKARWRGIN